MAMDPNQRFRDWYKWRGFASQEEAADLLGVRQATISMVLRGARVGLDLAVAIERHSATWPDGPIRAAEWVSPRKDDAPSAVDGSAEPAAEARS